MFPETTVTHHTWKMSPHYLVKCTTFSSDWRYVAFLQTLVALKKPVVGWHWWLREEPVLMCGKWNIRQATLQQMFKVTTFCADSSLFRHWSTASSTTLCWNSAHVATRRFCNSSILRIASTWYAWKKWKRWKICAFYKVTFLGVMGEGVTVCFLLR